MNAVDLFPHIWQNNYSLLIALFLICTNESCSLSEWTDIYEKHPLTLDSCSQWNLKKHFPHIQSPIWDQQSSSRLCISPPCPFALVALEESYPFQAERVCYKDLGITNFKAGMWLSKFSWYLPLRSYQHLYTQNTAIGQKPPQVFMYESSRIVPQFFL